MGLRIAPFAAFATVAFATPAFAHHSLAMFNQEVTITLSGTVKELEWIQPHSWLHMMIPDANNRPQEWSFEMGGIGQLANQGWTRDLVKPGDKLTITVHPLKDGSRGGQYLGAQLADGKIFREERNTTPGANVIGGGQ
jgi:hypothetical protein